jgi:hypothetical protein
MVSDIAAKDGKIAKLFLQCSVTPPVTHSLVLWQFWTHSLVNSSLLNSHSLSIGLRDSLFNLSLYA